MPRKLRGLNARSFERLHALGDERFTKILNLLMRGQPAQCVAREMQQAPPKGWGLFQEVSEKTLTQQLNRLRLAAAEGAFGKVAAEQIARGQGHTPQVQFLKHASIPVLMRLEELSEKQRTLCLTLIDKAIGDQRTFTSVNEAVDGYRKILLDLQKIRFDLGLDEFKGPASGPTIKGMSQTTTFPDGMSVQKQVFEAVTAIEHIFDVRQIPQEVKG